MPQSKDHKEYYINFSRKDIEELHELMKIETQEEALRQFNHAAIEFKQKVSESTAWMDSGGYLHAVPKENKEK